jgi:hypothetical protein
MDVGWNRTAVLWVAHDPTSAVVSLYRKHYQGQGEPASHAQGYAPGPAPSVPQWRYRHPDFGFVNRISRARQGEMWMESLGAPRFTAKHDLKVVTRTPAVGWFVSRLFIDAKKHLS